MDSSTLKKSHNDDLVEFFAFLWKTRKATIFGMLSGIALSLAAIALIERNSQHVRLTYDLSFDAKGQHFVPTQAMINEIITSPLGASAFCQKILESTSNNIGCEPRASDDSKSRMPMPTPDNAVNAMVTVYFSSHQLGVLPKDEDILLGMTAAIDQYNLKNSRNFAAQEAQLNQVLNIKIQLLKILTALKAQTSGVSEKSQISIKDQNSPYYSEAMLSEGLNLIASSHENRASLETLKNEFFKVYHELSVAERQYHEALNKVTSASFIQYEKPSAASRIGSVAEENRKVNRGILVFLAGIIGGVFFLMISLLIEFIRTNSRQIMGRQQNESCP